MNIKIYPKDNGEGFSADEIRAGHHWVYSDVTCPHCGKVQPMAATRYMGGPCCACGKLTNGKII